MPVREVLKIGDSRLREKASTVDAFDADLMTLIEDMKATLRAEGGIGLAATQIGIPLRVIVVCSDGDPAGLMMAFVNPEIVYTLGTQVNVEGCLSVPGEHGEVRRAFKVRIKHRTHNRNVDIYTTRGLEAACFQHEIDHLNGMLFTDRLLTAPKKA